MRGFFGTVFGVYFFVNFYLFVRLFQSLARTGALRAVACAAILIFSMCFPAARLLSGRLPDTTIRALSAMGNLYVAPMLYAFLLTLAADIYRVLNRVFTITNNAPPYPAETGLPAVVAIFAISVLIAALGGINAITPAVKEVDMWTRGDDGSAARAPHTPAFLRIAVLSDIHIGGNTGTGYLGKLVEMTNAVSPDIVLLPGDIIDGTRFFSDERTVREKVEILKSFQARLGVWGVLGNHDYYSGVSDSEAFLAAAGIRILRDEAVTIDGKFILAGRDDRTALFSGNGRMSIEDILSSVPQTDDGTQHPIILMDHQPFDLHEAEQCGVALQISGHTHRGQLWPLNFVVSRMYERSYGEYKRGDTNYFISSGAGVWGPPIRTIGRPEIVVINLFDN